MNDMARKKRDKYKPNNIILAVGVLLVLVLSLWGFKMYPFSITQTYSTELTEPGSLPWWSGECRDESSECKQLYGIVPFTNTIIVDNDWKITNSISTPYIPNGYGWKCHQVVYVYYQDELLGSVEQPDSGGFMVDMTNKVFYDDYNEAEITNAKDYMRIRKVKSRYNGLYYRCDYYLNEIMWIHRECVQDSDCDDDNPYTLYDKCENNVCIVSDPVECVSDSDCEYFNECKSNACVIKDDYKDNDNDGVINKDDACPNVAGSGSDGCCTIIEKIQNYINKLITIIMNMLG